MKRMISRNAQDSIPHEDYFALSREDGMVQASFFAFNTVIDLAAFGDEDIAEPAMREACDLCRHYERLFSRTLPHSDVSRVNSAAGQATEVDRETFDVVRMALNYCEASEGTFDVTIGPAVRLWNFHEHTRPNPDELARAMEHVDWRGIVLAEGDGRFTVQLADPQSSIDLGGIAKGYIADALDHQLAAAGLDSFTINLGGNVVAHGSKPDGSPWMVGIRNPKQPDTILGALPLKDMSAVTSGIYERGFEEGGQWYHHILDAKTGMPVETDIASATVVAPRSIDAEGYSTTLLALGLNRASAFVRAHPAIVTAVFVDEDNELYQV